MSLIWKKAVVNGEMEVDTCIDPADTANGKITMTDTTAIASPYFRLDVAGTVCTVGINVTNAGSAVTADLIMEGSLDNTTWITVKTIAANVAPQTTGLKQYVVNLTDTICPFLRLKFNSVGGAVGSSGKFKFLIGGIQHFKERSL